MRRSTLNHDDQELVGTRWSAVKNVDFSSSVKKTKHDAGVDWNHLYLVSDRMLTHVTLRHAFCVPCVPTHDCLNIFTRKVARPFLMI